MPSSRAISTARPPSRSCCSWCRWCSASTSSSGVACLSAPRPVAANRATLSPGAWLGWVAAGLVLLLFVLFFVVPLVWLLLAPTKTDRQLLLDPPFAFGG